MRSTPTANRFATPALATALCLAGALLTGCQADRPVVAPAEPAWSYHDGDTQLSNNDAWEKMIPATAVVTADSARVASVEEPTD